MIFLVLVLAFALLSLGWRRIEYWGYLKMGEEYERREALRGEKVGIPYHRRAGERE